MAVTWTEDQRRVIDTRKKNILVSAAAGSGKTAVLSQRILSLIMDPEDPADIDELLVVTFTRAAADEMRERIRQALEDAHRQHPRDRHLLRQLTLIHSSSIMTIDSFCSQVVRNYFQEVDLDPSFRVGEDGELRLLQQDVLGNVLEEAYEEGEKDFLKFADCYASGQNDKMLEQLILRLYGFSQSYPWPEQWLEQCGGIQDCPEGTGNHWLATLIAGIHKTIESYEAYAGMALRICQEPDGPWMYDPMVTSDLEALEAMKAAADYGALYEAVTGYAPQRLSAKKDPAVSEAKKEMVKSLRETWKSGIDDLKKKYFTQNEQKMQEIMQKSTWASDVLVRITLRFLHAYEEAKREKNLVDFSDLEHDAVQIFCGEDGRPTDAARAYAARYREIFIDEYQDSNLVQEILLNSISGESRGLHNLFMVGDVKQSIYSFRLARPELFIEKYNRYGAGEEGCLRIDLKQNFRSREEVLESVNFLFRQLMQPDLGAIAYDDAAALYPGAVYAPGQQQETEVLLLNDRPDAGEDGRTARELEAKICADRIRALMGQLQVTDKETGQLRPVRYSDMVILMRAMDGWADVYQDVLEEEGIPCRTVLRSGYFNAYEIQTMLNMLRIIDNPRQDIPLTAVMKSVMGGFDEQELALIRGAYPDVSFHEACQRCAGADTTGSSQKVSDADIMGNDRKASRTDGTGKNWEALCRKTAAFYAMLEHYRQMLPYTPIHQLIGVILDETGFSACVSAMPGGEVRTANLAMLADRAMVFESTSYKGLFHFIRYIDRMIRFQVDYGEADAGTERPDAVEIQSIHKSKGLEYPVVFVTGLGKRFNEMDARSMAALHMEDGIGMDAIDPVRRLRMPTLKKKAIQRRMKEEMLGEELRVLYVAMTRAKEKLILTGAVKDREKRMLSWYREAGNPATTITYATRFSAGSCLDLIMPALLRNQCCEELLKEADLWPPFGHALYRADTRTRVYWVEPFSLASQSVKRELTRQDRTKRWEALLGQEAADSTLSPEARAVRDHLRELLDTPYPWEAQTHLPVKLSVSELKRQKRLLEDVEQEELYQEETVIPLIPRFLQEQEETSGALRGDAYHHLMERLDFGTMKPETGAVQQAAEQYIAVGVYTAEEYALVEPADIAKMLGSPLGRRMAAAAEQGLLYREQPFVLGIPMASAVSSESLHGEELRMTQEAAGSIAGSTDEWTLVQGIIDAFFYEDGEIVLMDYKTDRLYREEDFRERYGIQLEYYRRALEQITGKQVKETWIYSFTLGRAIRL